MSDQARRDWDIREFPQGALVTSSDGYEKFLWEVKEPVRCDAKPGDTEHGKPVTGWDGLLVKRLDWVEPADPDLPYIFAGYVLAKTKPGETVICRLN